MLTSRKILIGALACMLGTSFLLTGCEKETSAGSAAAARQAAPVQVKVVTLKSSDHAVDSVLTGRTSAYYVAEVRPQVNGILQKRLFTEGAEVEAGEVLYQIDPATYDAAYKSAVASLAQAKATLVQARADAKRSRDLVKIKAVSQQSDDAAQATLKTALAAVDAAEAQVLSAKINLDYTKVTSPISGRVSRTEFTEGALLTAYQTSVLTTVQQLDPIYVDVTQTAEDLIRIKREIAAGSLKVDQDGNAPVRLTLPDGSAYAHEGKLTFTDAQVEETTGSVKLRAVFPNPNRDLLPGMYVRATLSEGIRPQSVTVSMQCVMRDNRGNPYVYVIGPGNKVEKRDVAVTHTIGTSWLVDSGLKAGERVVYEGFQRTSVGATVDPKEFDPASEPEGKPLF